MHFTAIFLLVAGLMAGAAGNTQGVSLSVKEAPLVKVFRELEKQTGYSFFYEDKLLQKAKKVTLKLENATLEQVLDACFTNQPLSYKIFNKTVVIKEKEPSSSSSSSASVAEAMAKATIDISGRVTDADGNPLSGASVKVKGSSLGTTTSSDGVFVLKGVDENATLEVSFVGYETYTVAVANKTSIIASLKVKPESLNEVVINKGYYTEKQKFSVGNVGRVTAKDIEKQPVSNPLLALQGRIPGLFIVQNSGVPNGGVKVEIQGRNSINNGNYPYVLVDGVPFFTFLPRAGNDEVLGSSGGAGTVAHGNPLSYINPQIIESIEVLKDADATAIYGSRAANGALLITTKKGKAGKTRATFNIQHGWGRVTRFMDMLNRRQYLDMRYEAYANDGINISTLPVNSRTYDLRVWDTTRETNWQKLLIGGTAKYTNVTAGLSGGAENIQYFISGTYSRETTVFPGEFSDQKASLYFNLNSNSANKRFRMEFSNSFLRDINDLPGIDLTGSANLLEPVAPNLYDADGKLNWAQTPSGVSTWDNPLVPVLYQNYKSQVNNLVSSMQLSYLVLKGLQIKSSFGYNFLQSNDFNAYPLISFKAENQPFASRYAVYGNRLLHGWNIEPQITYERNILKGKLEALVGATIQQNTATAGSIQGSGHISDELLKDFKSAATFEAGNSTVSEQKYNAAFGRLNYNLLSKYIVNFTARRDGSSRFGENNRFHNFWSIGGGWLFGEEEIVAKKSSLISFGKLRASYGTTGNDQIPDYLFLSLYNTVNAGVPYQGTSGLLPSRLPNPYIQWEETKKLQVGIDLGFWSDRVLISATYSRNRSSNQLLSYALPTVTGRAAITDNFPATVQNSNWEISLNSANIKSKNVQWSTSLNFTFPQNELKSFPNIEKSTYANSLIIGQPLSISKIYQFGGVDPTTGLYVALTKNGISSSPNYDTDRTILLTSLPKFYGGLENNIVFKSFNLDFLFQFVQQKGFNNYFNNGTIIAPGSFLSGTSNQPVTVLDRWQNPGDITRVQKYTSNRSSTTADLVNIIAKGSDAGLSNAFYARLKNVSLSWNMPIAWQQRLHLQSSRLFIHAQNLLTITNYEGMDPENQGFQSLPPLRMLTIGIQMGF